MKNGNAYFNNSVATPEQRSRLNQSDITQKQAVIEVLRTVKRPLTDAEITNEIRKRKLLHATVRRGSIQRARCNLKQEGKIEATGDKRDGGAGVDINCWRLKKKAEQQSKLFGDPKNPGAYAL